MLRINAASDKNSRQTLHSVIMSTTKSMNTNIIIELMLWPVVDISTHLFRMIFLFNDHKIDYFLFYHLEFHIVSQILSFFFFKNCLFELEIIEFHNNLNILPYVTHLTHTRTETMFLIRLKYFVYESNRWKITNMLNNDDNPFCK